MMSQRYSTGTYYWPDASTRLDVSDHIQGSGTPRTWSRSSI